MGRSAYTATHQQRIYANALPVHHQPKIPPKRQAPRKPSVPVRVPPIQERRRSRRSSQHMVTPGCGAWLPGGWSCYRAPCASAAHYQPCYPPDYGLPRLPCLPRSPWPHYFHPIVVTTQPQMNILRPTEETHLQHHHQQYRQSEHQFKTVGARGPEAHGVPHPHEQHDQHQARSNEVHQSDKPPHIRPTQKKNKRPQLV